MKSKLIASLVAITLLVSSLAGCGGSGTATYTGKSTAGVSQESSEASGGSAKSSGNPTKVTFLYPGDENDRLKEYISKELKEKLIKDINIELEVQFVPWSAYGAGNKIDMMMAAGEPFDMSMTDHSWLNLNVQKKTVFDLSGLVDKFCPDLKKNMEPEAFANYTFNNKLYALPVGGKPTGAALYSVAVRQDILEAVGMKEITSIADLEKFADLAKAKYPDMYATTDYNLPPYIRGYSDKHYTVSRDNGAVLVDQDTGTLVSLLDTPEFKTHCEFTQRLYKKGLIPKDVLTNKTTIPFLSGKFLWMFGTCGTAVTERTPGLVQNVPTAKIKEYLLNPTAPKYKESYESTAFMVPAYSENAEAVCKLVNYMQKDEDSYNTFVYGVKDKDYKVVNNKIERITPTDFFYNWALFNINFPVFETYVPDEFISAYKKWDDNSVASKALGFTLNIESVASEKAKLDALYTERIVPMLAGLVSYDSGIETAKKEMKTAGWDKFFGEMQKQFADFRATQK